MSSQWMDPGQADDLVAGAIWTAPAHEPQAAQAAHQGSLAAEASTAVSALPETEADTEGLADDGYPASRFETLWLFLKQFSPVLLPLLFGAVTFLLLVPAALHGKAYLSHAGLLPAALILLAIAILHGVMLYYAADNAVLWSLALACGVALFLVAGSFALFGPLVSLILLILVVVVGVAILRYLLHPVPEGYVDIVFAFGQYRRTLFPGPNLLLPWEHVAQRLNTRRTQWTCPPQVVHLTPDEDVYLSATICYQLLPEDAYLAVTEVNNWEASLQQLLLTTIQAVVSTFSVGYFLARRSPAYGAASSFDEGITSWEVVNSELTERMQDQVAIWGVQIHWVHIHDVAVVPRGSLPPDTDAMETVKAEARVANGSQGGQEAALSGAGADIGAAQSLAATARAADSTPGLGRTANSVQAQAEERSAAATSSAPSPSPKTLKEEILVSTYNAVREGRITDPETIASIAARFEAVANDPELNRLVSFDAARAARALRQRAELIREQRQRMRAYAPQYADQTELERPGRD
ncbi:SPFH domain-containing protein [Thermogemmatispora sp.]|uniref:SPFH domain-containing protein n=1 Tax=Thermogemmatispora sp. TaxID=1968838 RepID=UPI001DE1C0F1|nr:SPFH domain-containing protein [Thermogemmatispora sp.]MBX5450042.1 SPFH domain-containing protein [Thermogemmatispora sp.]